MACSDRPHGFGFIDLKRRHSHARREKGSPTRKPESLTQARLREQLSSATEYEAQRTLKWPLQSSNESAIRQCWQSFAIRGSVRRHKPCLFCTIQELAVCLWVRVSEQACQSEPCVFPATMDHRDRLEAVHVCFGTARATNELSICSDACLAHNPPRHRDRAFLSRDALLLRPFPDGPMETPGSNFNFGREGCHPGAGPAGGTGVDCRLRNPINVPPRPMPQSFFSVGQLSWNGASLPVMSSV